MEAHQLCSKHMGGAWASVSPEEISMVPVSGGTSNTLFCCSLPETISPIKSGEPTQVLLRFYGDQWRDCDMSVQLEIFSLLSSKNLGPKLYGTFDNGRIEEYLPANSLTSDELRNKQISSIIAKKLAMIHSLEVPIEKNNRWISERYEEFIDFIEKLPDIDTYIKEEDLSEPTEDLVRRLRCLNYRDEQKFVLELLDKTDSEIVFSHNDLHQGNILLAKRSSRRPTLDERVFFIDFEYCSYNYRAYDIANHFCEWCFQYDTPDYPHFEYSRNKFPTEEEQRSFVRIYLNQKRDLAIKQDIDSPDDIPAQDKKTSNGHNRANGHSNPADILIQEEDVLLAEVRPLMIAANLLWTLWCVKCAYNSKIKFGFLEHAAARWDLYSEMKSNYIKTVVSQTNGTKR